MFNSIFNQTQKTDWNSSARDSKQQPVTLSPNVLQPRLLNRDYPKLGWTVETALEMVSKLDRTLSEQAQQDLPTLSELLTLAVQRISRQIESCRYLPGYVKQAWLRQVQSIVLEDAVASLDIVEELYFDHRCALEDYQPGRSGSTDENQGGDFARDLSYLYQELNSLELILKYAKSAQQLP
ncbi:MAG: hypothetical protein HC934_06985 [Acaryochloridaceae cyanobacterium SU_2_1]|nr:hypothetical protein [Acaryochloridaceae cyanobacterium SU_2_1]NJM95468.1 hypothetical protein [Acaryochloridaceae cyanobacterium CSU_5_19]